LCAAGYQDAFIAWAGEDQKVADQQDQYYEKPHRKHKSRLSLINPNTVPMIGCCKNIFYTPL
jgi:hypothetical protein